MKNVSKSLKYFIAIAALSSSLHAEGTSKTVFVNLEKKIGVPDNAGTATQEELAKKGFRAPNRSEQQALNRLDAKCEVTCGNHITTSGHVTYDNRIACKKSCMSAEGWEFTYIREDAQ